MAMAPSSIAHPTPALFQPADSMSAGRCDTLIVASATYRGYAPSGLARGL